MSGTVKTEAGVGGQSQMVTTYTDDVVGGARDDGILGGWVPGAAAGAPGHDGRGPQQVLMHDERDSTTGVPRIETTRNRAAA